MNYLPLATKLGRSCWLVVKDLLDLLHRLVVELLQQLNSLAVVFDLLDLGRTENDGADIGVLCGPSQGKLAHVSSETLRNLGQFLDLLNLSLALGLLQGLDGASEEVLVVCEARALGNAVVVLAGEQAGGERRPDGGAILVLVVERGVLDFKPLTVEGVVLRLLGDGGNQVVPLGDLGSFLNLDSGPLRSAPVVSEVEIANDLSESLDDLLHWSGVVGSVSENDIDVRLLKTLERRLETFDHVLAGQTTGIGLLSASAEEDLGRENVFITRPVELLQGVAHLDFGLAIGIDLPMIRRVQAKDAHWLTSAVSKKLIP